MKKFIVLLLPIVFLYAPTRTFYSDWDWGYYFWLFGPVGPNHSQGMAAAGYSSMEYRGYNQFTLSSYPGAPVQISALTLRLRNNTGGAGLQIDINRVLSDTPGWDECGATAPIYLTNQAVSANAEEYTYFNLTGTQAVDDFIAAWQTSAWFGFGYKGSRGSGEPCMHFFYAFWADEILDAALIVDYVIIGKEERASEAISPRYMSIQPNPCKNRVYINLETGQYEVDIMDLTVYDAVGKMIKTFSIQKTYSSTPSVLIWDGTDLNGKKVKSGVYFIRLLVGNNIYTEKVILIH